MSDANMNQHAPPPPSPPRVLSLLSAATEIVARLGCTHLLVGRSHGCDDPALVTSLPVATAPRVNPNAPSSELDAQVRVQAASGGPIYQIDNALVSSAQPTVIITQEQCRICAVTPEDLTRACDNLLPPSAKLITIMPVSLEDVLGDVMTIANAMGVPDRGTRLVAHIRRQLTALQSSTLDVLGNFPRPKVAHVEWLAPLMGSGYWIAECVNYASGEMVHGYAGGHSQTLEKVELLSNADFIIIAPCGFSIERTWEELQTMNILDSIEWRELPAVVGGRVAIADGNKYYNRSSVASILGTAEIVAEFIHPEMRGMYGHHGERWVRLEEIHAFCGRAGAEPTKKDVVLANGIPEQGRATLKSLQCDSTTKNSMTIQHVENQIAALQRGDYDAAFLLNSPENKKRLVSAEKFEAIVSGWTSFKVLSFPQTSCEYREVQVDGTIANVKVEARAEASDEVLCFFFDLRRSENGGPWETDGVRIEC
mmetsp:Transcript_5572/g.10772  ORF Transcript_5572/g.10772 Transcript_5572/m.10772 type:complete len:481 (+) Transcript_5572:162-1604(+)